MNVLMVGVSRKRVGGMWTVASQYIEDQVYNQKVNLTYVATSTNGTLLKRFLFMLYGYLKIKVILHYKNIDILHIHMAEKGSTFRKGKIVRWGNKINVKVVIHLHAGPFLNWFDTLNYKKQEKVKEIFKYADKVVVLGDYWKNELKSIFELEKMTVIYNGVDTPNQNLYNDKAFNIVYFGVMSKSKGIFDLIKAISNIDKDLCADVKVILCGNDLTGSIQTLIDKYCLGDRIQMYGWVDKKDIDEIYKSAMISVLPSYFEGLSMSVIESMSYGIPVLTTNISTMPEIFGENYPLIEPGDIEELGKSIISLSDNINERRYISGYVYEKCKTTFSKEAFIAKTLNLYKEMMEE